jgi:methionine salvage enolase-phosphatase E1
MNVTYVLDFSMLNHFSLRAMFSDNARVTSYECAVRHVNLQVQSSLFLSDIIQNFKALTDFGKQVTAICKENRSSDSVAAKRTT